jgi:hypothetical protein
MNLFESKLTEKDDFKSKIISLSQLFSIIVQSIQVN